MNASVSVRAYAAKSSAVWISATAVALILWFALYWRLEDFSGWLVARLPLTPDGHLAEAALAVGQFLGEQVGALGQQLLVPAQRQQVARARDEFVVVDGGVEEVGRARLERAQPIAAFLVDGYDDHRHVGVALGRAQGAHEIGAVHFRHIVVGDDQIGRVLDEPGKSFPRIGESPDVDVRSDRSRELREDVPVRNPVVDDHYKRPWG